MMVPCPRCQQLGRSGRPAGLAAEGCLLCRGDRVGMPHRIPIDRLGGRAGFVPAELAAAYQLGPGADWPGRANLPYLASLRARFLTDPT